MSPVNESNAPIHLIGQRNREKTVSGLRGILRTLDSACSDAVDTDGDGLLDLVDVDGFDPNDGRGTYLGKGIQDLDGANLLINLQTLDLHFNLIKSVESSDFAGLSNLQRLYLRRNLASLNTHKAYYQAVEIR